MTKPLSLTQARRLLLATLLVVTLVLGYRFSLGFLNTEGAVIPGDFHVYWKACERMLSGVSFYVPSDASPYKYSPTFTYLFRGTFFLLPERMAAALWMLFSVLTFFAGFYALGRELLVRCERRGTLLAAITLALALSWRGFLETLSYGQADMLLAGGFFFVVASGLRRGRPWGRVGVWTLLLVVKPHFGIVLLPACFAFGWKEGAKVFAAAAAAYFAPVLWLGPAGLLQLFSDWVRCLVVQQDVNFLTNNLNQAFATVAARVSGSRELVGRFTAAALGFYLLLLGAAAFRAGVRNWWRGASHERTRLAWLAFGLAAYLVFSPLSWRWLIADWAPLVAIAFVLARRARFLLPWLFFALLSQRVVAGALHLHAKEEVSFYGFYALGNLALFLLIAWLLARELANERP